MSEPQADRYDFPRALARFLDRLEVYRELQKVTNHPLELRAALLDCAWALEEDDPADGSPLPKGRGRASAMTPPSNSDERARHAEKRIATLERALRWYADPNHWRRDDWGVEAVVVSPEYGQPGDKARRALKRAGSDA